MLCIIIFYILDLISTNCFQLQNMKIYIYIILIFFENNQKLLSDFLGIKIEEMILVNFYNKSN